MTPSSDLSAVNALLEERGALRGWLDGLDARAASVPEAVLSRVRQDYQVRLDQVIDCESSTCDAVDRDGGEPAVGAEAVDENGRDAAGAESTQLRHHIAVRCDEESAHLLFAEKVEKIGRAHV